MKTFIHIPSGGTALVRECQPKRKTTVLAQFDDPKHEHSHGWFRYPRADFRPRDRMTIIREALIVTAKMFPHNPVGCVMRHPDGRMVYIASGSYLSHGRVSNFWYWHPINDDGTLGPQEHGYGW